MAAQWDDCYPELHSAPLDGNPALFREFAAIEPTDRSAILAFANRYGQLGVWEALFPAELPAELLSEFSSTEREQLIEYASGRRSKSDLALGSKEKEFFAGYLAMPGAETHAKWLHAIEEMRLAVHLWDLVQAGDRSQLARIFVRPDDADPFRGGSLGYWNLIDPFTQTTWRLVSGGYGRRDEWRGTISAKHWSMRSHLDDETEFNVLAFDPRAVTDRDDLFQLTRAVALQSVNVNLWRRVQPDIALNPSTGEPVLRMYPDDLLRAMWLQFAQGIAGHKEYRVCNFCNAWFEISTAEDGRTARRLFCTDACKSRDYRRRKNEGSKPPKRKKK